MPEYGFSLTCIFPYKYSIVEKNCPKKTYSAIFYAVSKKQILKMIYVNVVSSA